MSKTSRTYHGASSRRFDDDDTPQLDRRKAGHKRKRNRVNWSKGHQRRFDQALRSGNVALIELYHLEDER